MVTLPESLRNLMRPAVCCVAIGLVVTALLSSSCRGQTAADADHVVLLNDHAETAQIVLLNPDHGAIRQAADDLHADLNAVAGKPTAPSLTSQIIVGCVDDLPEDMQGINVDEMRRKLAGKWEAYRVFTRNNRLYILGSDVRGTMWGIYQVSEVCLGIDPMYLWTGKTPQPRREIVLSKVHLASDGPSFKYRGWFINDEDYLTECKPFEGRRNNDYKYYARIIHPDVTDKIIETALRLRMNTLIPSSFNDILNPPEAYAVNKAAERGLIVTQHHIEPLGVGGFNFDDYFERQGKKVPLFSYLKNPEPLKEVWEQYVKAWARYPEVIWQLGLRGRGDRPMWVHDPSIPRDNAARGKIISDAIKVQYDLVRKYDPDGLMTLTLWLEMARLMEQGHIQIPDDIIVVFADNSPGWGFSRDFYSLPRQPDRQYGIYYHHQLWGTGPHFIQGIPPQKTRQVIADAVKHHSSSYCVLNTGNIREFVLGLKLSSELLFDFDDYAVDEASGRWFDFHYGPWAGEAARVYEHFFDHYLLDTENKYPTGFSRMPNSPFLLDGHLAGRMKQMLTDLNKSFGLDTFQGESWITAGELRSPKTLKWSDKHEDLLGKIRQQSANLRGVIREADTLHSKMSDYPARFFDANLRIPAKVFDGLMGCTAQTMLAVKAEQQGDRKTSVEHLREALRIIHQANVIKQTALQAPWKGWYRGEYKIMLSSYEEYLQYLIHGATGDSRK
ncbi:hypothetical protein HED60_06350 [Planctomycetales bacterium ZRK34]|nr:hypothetical protein HED60_06350 [Planctomycetales bacterium ZRK34]